MNEADALARLYARYSSTQEAAGAAQAATLALRRPYLQRLVARHFPAERSAAILELGCGSGALLGFLRELGYRRTEGVDTSPEQVALAASRGLDCVTLGDAAAALGRTGSGTLDVVMAFDVLEHLSLGQLLVVTEEARRVLRPGGRFIVHVPNGAALLGPAVYYSDLTHRTCFTARSLRQLFAVCGFAGVAFDEDCPVVHGPLSFARWCGWKALRTAAWVAYAIETGDVRGRQIFSQGIVAVATR